MTLPKYPLPHPFREMNFLIPREIAELLKVRVDTIHRLAKKGDLPGKRVGRQWRFREDVVLEWIQSNFTRISNADLEKSDSELSEIRETAKRILGR